MKISAMYPIGNAISKYFANSVKVWGCIKLKNRWEVTIVIKIAPTIVKPALAAEIISLKMGDEVYVSFRKK